MLGRENGWKRVLGVLAVGVAALTCSDDDGGSSTDDAPDASLEDDGADDETGDDEAGDGADASVSADDGDDDGAEQPGEGEVVSETIDAATGGELTSADGVLTLIVPEGALEENTEISIRIVPEQEWSEAVSDLEPASAVYDVQPDGLQFAVPAQLRFEWSDVPDALAFDEDGAAVLGLVYSQSQGDEPEELASELHYTREGDGLTVTAETDHLSNKVVSGTNRGCVVRVAAATGTFSVGYSWPATTFSFSCSGNAAESVSSVRPAASSSNLGVVGVAFPSSMEGDRFIAGLSGGFWYPGSSESVSGSGAIDLEKPTWTCLEEGDSVISGGAVITRGETPVFVAVEIGPVGCEVCDLDEAQDCENLEQLDLENCECVCPHDENYECPAGMQFNSQNCACECINSSCPSENERVNPETCECECTLTNGDCESFQRVNTETCECECSQRQNCSGATPHWNSDSCQCECQVSADDCSSPLVFWAEQCQCDCQEAIDGEWQCPSDFQERNLDTCECECDAAAAVVGPEWCEQLNKVWDPELCDCVCERTADECTGRQFFDEEACGCYCSYDEADRQCTGNFYFDGEACDCLCDLEEECPPDFARNPETCECECILDQEASCLPGQVLFQDTCTCGCETTNEDCSPEKTVNPDNCECECSQLQNCSGAFPVWDPETCQCVCEVSQADCTGETPFFSAAQCACGPHIFYALEGRTVTLSGCDDSDDQVTITNVTETGFTLEGLANNNPIEMTLTGGTGRTAAGSNVTQFGQGGHDITFTFNADSTPESGSGSFAASSNSGSCSATLSY